MSGIIAAVWALAKPLLPRRGFEVCGYPTMHEDGLGCDLDVMHDCGALTRIGIRPPPAWRGGEEYVRRIASVLDAGAVCYCVRREVLVPCTAQRCEP